MKIKNLSAVISLWCFLVFVGNVVAAPGQPKLEIPSASYDFDSVTQGEIVKHDFKLKNSGNGDLLIHKVIPGCGCTATKISSKTVPPGGESVISVEFNSSGFVGKKVRTISVETNDPKMPVVNLIIQGVINPEVTVEPNALSFGEVEIGKTTELELVIKKAPGSKTSIREVSSRNNLIVISKVKELSEQSFYKVTIRGEGKIGPVRGLININLNNKDRTTVPVPFFASFVKARG